MGDWHQCQFNRLRESQQLPVHYECQMLCTSTEGYHDKQHHIEGNTLQKRRAWSRPCKSIEGPTGHAYVKWCMHQNATVAASNTRGKRAQKVKGAKITRPKSCHSGMEQTFGDTK
jgi:hypothetical protein